VGKSFLAKHFVLLGLKRLSLVSCIREHTVLSQNHQVWQSCLDGNYHHIIEPIPMFHSQYCNKALVNRVKEQSLDSGVIVEFPSFFDVCQVIKDICFDCVIAVDCSDGVHIGYIDTLEISDTSKKALLNSGEEQEYYRSQATDIFHNTISEDHVHWVAKQILQTYLLASQVY
jgi:hypothetical protein